MTKLKKSAVGILAVLSASCLASSAVAYAFKGDGKSTKYVNSDITKVNTRIDANTSEYFDSSVVYRLPETVNSQDDVSVIVTMDTQSVLEAYRNSGVEGKFSDYATTKEAKRVSERVSFDANQLISRLNDSKINYTLGNRYDTLLSGFEVTVKAKDFDRLDYILGNEATLIVGDTYERCETEIITNEVDVYETGIFDSSSSKYQGDGVVVAVLDTGLDYTHSAFSVENFTSSQKAFTLDNVSAKINRTTAAKRTANLTGNDVYVNEKVPYAYDYADNDADVFPINSSHGTHVAGIIAGNDDTITGVAPNAQLAIMKVFSDSQEGARTSNIVAALEDCVVLGVDVINMSLGTSCGFTREVDKENINVIYDSIKDAGISLITAASNDYNATFGSEKNGSNGTTYNPDSGTVGSPSTYEGSLSVASVDGVKTPYLKYGEDIIYFTEASTSASKKKNFVDDILKTLGDGVTEHEFDYVTIPGVGRSSDYMETSEFYKDKIVLVKRGTTTFEDKVRVALNEKGAAGIIIYNNVSGTISMSVGKDIGAVCSISQDEGEKLAAAQTGKLLISKSQTAGPFMSDFSSWGPTSDLRIKPEITAHGGEILSAVPGQNYDRLSGTSMAAPNQAGAAALIRQYVKYSGVFGSLDTSDKAKEVTALVNQLMMSTADIVYNKNGLPYAVRKQGAGLVNITKAYTSASYITTYDKDGKAMEKTKIELDDDKNKTGVYEMTFDINNVSGEAVSYDIGSLVITEGVSPIYTGHGDTTVTQDGKLLAAETSVKSVNGGQNNGNVVSVAANGTAKVTVVITLSDSDKKYLDESFANGMYVEGFITLKATSGTNVDMNVPLLAFYGDWTQAPIFDEEYYDTHADEINAGLDPEDKLMADAYATRVIGGLYSDYIATLGTYYFVQDPKSTQIAANKEHIAISVNEDGSASSITSIRNVYAGMLRNAKEVDISITEDASGYEIFQKTVTNQRKSFSSGNNIYPSSIDVEFAALAHDLKNNTKYTVTLTAYIDYGSKEEQKNLRNTFTFPLFVDFEAPIVTDVAFRTEYDRTTKKTQLFADLSVYDNHYAMGIQTGQVYPTENPGPDDAIFTMAAFGKYITPVYSSFNSTSSVTVELTDYISQIKNSSGLKFDKDGNVSVEYNNNSFIAIVYDYAMNSATYEIRLPDEVLSMAFAEDEIRLSPNETLDIASPESGVLDIYPVSTWAQVLDYKSEDKEIADVINQTILAKKTGTTVITVTGKDADGKIVSASVNVKVLGPEDEGYVGGYTMPEINKFTLTGYTTNKAYYSVSSSEREIGITGGSYDFAGDFSLSMYPSESITLKYALDSYFNDKTDVTFSVGNERIATVTEDGTVVAQAEGNTIVFLNVTFDGRPTIYSARLNVTVKDPFTTNSIYLNSYKGLGGEVVIPSDRGITTIYSYAFSNFNYVEKDVTKGDVIDEEDPYLLKQNYIGEDTITKIVIPDGIEEIQSYAFANLTALKEVVIQGASLKKIGVGAFYGCKNLTNINLENVQFINESAFYGCKLTRIALDSVVALGDYAFANCKLNYLSLPVSAQSLGIGAFRNNETLTSIEFKAPKMKIGSYAFANCIRLVEANVNAAVVSSHAFDGCTSLNKVTFGKDVSVIGELAFADTKVASFKIDAKNAELTSAENGALIFRGEELVLVAPAYAERTITLTATEISSGAFAGNKNVTYVYANAATAVGNYAFANCTNLRRVDMAKIEDIGDYAFYNTALAATPDLSKVKNIGKYAFANTSIASADIADEAVVGEYAFAYNDRLATVKIGNGVKIGNSAFYTPINYAATYENNADKFDLKSFNNYFLTYYTPFTYAPEGGSETYNYYRYNYSLMATSNLESVTVGDDVDIGERAFSDNARLASLTLGDNAVIGDRAFYSCYNLASANLEKAASIGKYAFSGEETANFNRTATGFELAYEYSYRSGKRETVDISVSSSAPKLSAVDLTGIESIGEGAFALNGVLETVTFGDKITEVPAHAFVRTAISEVTLPQKISAIGEYAFYGTKLGEVDLSNVYYIGSYAFANTDLNKATLNAEGFLDGDELSYTLIGGAVFAYDGLLTEVVNLDKASLIGDYAFYGTGLESVTLTNLQYLGSYAFENSAVKDVTFGTKLSELGDNPFANCRIATFGRLQDKKFGDGVIGREMEETYDLSDTVKVVDGVLYQILPNGMELVSYPVGKTDKNYTVLEGTVRISANAFANSKVKNVTIAKTVKTLGDKAFYSCPNLAMVVFKGYEAPMLEEAFQSDYAINTNSPVPNAMGISKYYMWNSSGDVTNYYYGATFVDYVGNSDGNLVMVKPSNGTGYDTFIFEQYFGAVAEGESAAMDETLRVIDLIAALPEATSITLESEAQIVEARNAYEKLSSVEQQSLVNNYERLTAAESTLKYLKGSQDIDPPTPSENGDNEMNFMQKHFYIGYIVAGVAIVCLVAYVLFTKLGKRGEQSLDSEVSGSEEESKPDEETKPEE